MAIDIVGSKLPSENKIGQNGYTGSSSDLPGQATSIKGFSTPCDLAAAHDDKWQKRNVGTQSLKAANVGASAGPKVPGALVANEAPLPTRGK